MFADVTGQLAPGFQGADRLYGYAQHDVETTLLATSSGVRRRCTQPTGPVRSTPSVRRQCVGRRQTPDFVGVPTDSLLDGFDSD